MAFACICDYIKHHITIYNIIYQSSSSFVHSYLPAVFFCFTKRHQAYLQLITHEADAMPLAK